MLIEMPSLLGKKLLVDMSTFEGLAEKKMYCLECFLYKISTFYRKNI